MVDERTRKVIEHGRRIRAVLAQHQFAPLALGEQVALLLALTEDLLDSVPLDRVEAFRSKLGPWLTEHCPEVMLLDDQVATLPAGLHARLKDTLGVLARSFAEGAGMNAGAGPGT
jgi:F-type H+/Na+-transporting ATPase subunit alpha